MILAEDTITVAEAAQRLGVHQSTIFRYVESGLLAAYRIGPRRIRIDRAALDALVTPTGLVA